MTPDELLSTTRAVRKRLDFLRPVDTALVHECLQLALQAPNGSNAQGWHFVLVADAAKRLALAEQYRKAWAGYIEQARAATVRLPEGAARHTQERVMDSATYLAENMHRVPLLLVPCMWGRVASPEPAAQAGFYASILPAVWSFMLAARTRGLGTCWTSLHLIYERECAAVLGIPFEKVTQCALIPVAHTLGEDFKPAPRKSLQDVLHIDQW